MQVRVWVPEHQAELIKAVAESLRPMPIEELADDVPPKPSSVEQSPTAKMLEFAAELEARHGIQVPARIKRSKLLLWLWIRRNRKQPSRLEGIQEEGRRRKIVRLQRRILTLQAQVKSLTDGDPQEIPLVVQRASEPPQSLVRGYRLVFHFPTKPPARTRDQAKNLGCAYHADKGYWTVKVTQADKEFALKDLHDMGAEILMEKEISG